MEPMRCLRENVDVEALLHLRGLLAREAARIRDAAERFALIGNPTRVAILWLIHQAQGKELCPCDLADVLGISIPAVSQQLLRLRQGRLVHNRRQGKTIFYTLTDAGEVALNLLDKWIPREPSDDR